MDTDRRDTPCPGQFIRIELESRGWNQVDLARILGRTTANVNEIVQGKRAILPEMAIALGQVFGTGPDIWMEREARYRLSLAQSPNEEVVRRTRLQQFAPIQDLERRHWIRRTTDIDDLEREVCRFYDISSPSETPTIGAQMRHGVGPATMNPAQLAWCFRAKHLATGVAARPYTAEAFNEGIKKLRRLAAWPEEARKVPRVLAAMGIRFVVIEPLPRSRIDGAAFWAEDKPVVALSLRYDRIDSFWHTLAHELSHIRHHDGLEVDVDLVGESRPSPAELTTIELRADKEAATTLLDQGELDDFVARLSPLYSRARINQFANRIRIHPGIIVGQLQHRGELKYSFMRETLVKVRDCVMAEALTDGWGHVLPTEI